MSSMPAIVVAAWHLGEISKAELVSQIPAHAEHDDLLVKVPALEESVHFRLRSSALSFDRFAGSD
jgi:hypothetical protein